MRRQKLFVMLLAVIMITGMLTACGQKNGGTTGAPTQSGKSTVEGNSSADSTADSKTDTKQTEGGEPFEMVMSYLYTGSVPKDLQMVEDEVNKITIPEIGVKVTLYPINIS